MSWGRVFLNVFLNLFLNLFLISSFTFPINSRLLLPLRVVKLQRAVNPLVVLVTGHQALCVSPTMLPGLSMLSRVLGVLPYQTRCTLTLSLLWMMGVMHVLMTVFLVRYRGRGMTLRGVVVLIFSLHYPQLEPEDAATLAADGRTPLIQLNNTIRGTFGKELARSPVTVPLLPSAGNFTLRSSVLDVSSIVVDVSSIAVNISSIADGVHVVPVELSAFDLNLASTMLL